MKDYQMKFFEKIIKTASMFIEVSIKIFFVAILFIIFLVSALTQNIKNFFSRKSTNFKNG